MGSKASRHGIFPGVRASRARCWVFGVGSGASWTEPPRSTRASGDGPRRLRRGREIVDERRAPPRAALPPAGVED